MPCAAPADQRAARAMEAEAVTPVSAAAHAAVQALKSGDAVQAAQAALHICLLSNREEPPPVLIEGVRAQAPS